MTLVNRLIIYLNNCFLGFQHVIGDLPSRERFMPVFLVTVFSHDLKLISPFQLNTGSFPNCQERIDVYIIVIWGAAIHHMLGIQDRADLVRKVSTGFGFLVQTRMVHWDMCYYYAIPVVRNQFRSLGSGWERRRLRAVQWCAAVRMDGPVDPVSVLPAAAAASSTASLAAAAGAMALHAGQL